MELDFEWDDAKAETNRRKHGIDFVEAIEVFADALRILWVDERKDYGEERLVTVGSTRAGDLLFVVYTDRDDRIWLISAPRATAFERRFYHEG